jgi:hypothetical protein
MTVYQYPDYLAHHGVKGMKWGVRRARSQMAKRTGRSKSSISDTEARQWKKDVKKGLTADIDWDKDTYTNYRSKADGRSVSEEYANAVITQQVRNAKAATLASTGAYIAGMAMVKAVLK